MVDEGWGVGQVSGAVEEGGKGQHFLSSVIPAELCFFREVPNLAFLPCDTLTEMVMG